MKFRSSSHRKAVMAKMHPSHGTRSDSISSGSSSSSDDISNYAKHKKSLHTQSIVFSRNNFTPTQAKAWLKQNDKKTGLDIKENSIRARQLSPKEIIPNTYRTKYIAPGIKLILGKLK